MTSSSSFSGKRVLVTGGANGLGKAIVKKFYEAGAIVIALDVDEKALKELKGTFPKVITITVDLLDWEGARKAMESVLPLNHLVNNAGIMPNETFFDSSSQGIDRTFGINFKAAFNLTQVFAKDIIARGGTEGGTIVNISSVKLGLKHSALLKDVPYLADRITIPVGPMYSCSKAALTMLTRCSATELGKHNIRVNSVRPTAMATALLGNLMKNPEVAAAAQQIMSRAGITKPLETYEAANLVFFLSSPESSMITGEDVAIDGGFGVS